MENSSFLPSEDSSDDGLHRSALPYRIAASPSVGSFGSALLSNGARKPGAVPAAELPSSFSTAPSRTVGREAVLVSIQQELGDLQAEMAKKVPGSAAELRARLFSLQRMFTAALEGM